MRLGAGAVGAAAVGAWIRAAWGFSAVGEISLPILYALAACLAAVVATRSRSWVGLGAAAAVVVAVLAVDAVDPGGVAPPGGTGTLSDPDGVLWMRLPTGWVEDSRARPKPADTPEGYFIRKWVPANFDISTSPELEVQVLRTTNRSWDMLRTSEGILEERRISRGPSTGVEWRIEAHGEGQIGLELHYAGRRIFVRFKAGLGPRGSSQDFETLRPELDRVLDSVTVVPGGWFAAIDRRVFGR